MKPVLFLFALLALYGYVGAFGYPGSVADSLRSTNLHKIEDGINKFTMNLFKSALKEKSGNFVTSPLSAYMVLAMAAYGAEGTTKEELWNVLHLPNESTETKANLKGILRRLKFANGALLLIGNKMFGRKDLSLKHDYREVLEGTFESPLETVDFGNNTQAAEIINTWSNRSTQGYIREIVNEDELEPTTALMLLNSVFFRGEWVQPFDPELTKPRPFFVSEDVVKDVPTMARFGFSPLGTLPRLNADFVMFPYKNGGDPKEATYMYLILPNIGHTLAEMEENIDSLTLEDLQKTSQSIVDVFLPKFNISSNLKLADHLRKLGVQSAFSQAANFSGIAENPEGLYVKNLGQKTFLSIDEKGTIGAAASFLYLIPMMLPRQMHFNRPFLVVIATKELILFAGKVVDPSI